MGDLENYSRIAKVPVRLGVWAMLGDTRTGRALQSVGADWICLDQQHGHFDDRAVRDALSNRDQPDVQILVRVMSADSALVGRALDSGADGVVVPMIETAEQAASVVRAASYPPKGARSWGPMHGSGDSTGLGSMTAPLIAVMVETTRALANVREIAATPGLDMIFVGPFDLALNLGRPPDELLADTSDQSPLRHIARACREAGMIAAAFGGTAENSIHLISHGYMWVACATDRSLVAEGFTSVRERIGRI